MPPASAPLTSSQERLPPTKEAAAKGQRGEEGRGVGNSAGAKALGECNVLGGKVGVSLGPATCCVTSGT